MLGQLPCFTVLGFDPLMQLLHDEDLLDVLKRAVDRPAAGAFNVAGQGVLPVSALLRIVGRGSIALPASVAYPATELLWRSYGVGSGVSLDFVRYVWAVDGDAARAAFDVSPRYSTREVAEAVARSI
jgi:UDP-glucose 4-epimerase